MDPTLLQEPLLTWFDAHRRELPWRDSRDPYAIWVSEVMLQQTQVETVRGRWGPFLERFPTVAALAAAEEAEVLAAWSGLGYYRRARGLHAAAREVVRAHGGALPGEVAALQALPGFGPYTAGAVASIAFGAQAPLVDGNVARVLSRLFRVAGDPGRGPVKRRLWELAAAAVPAARPGDWNQALMELGALVCRPQAPRCPECPLRARCQALAADEVRRYPTPARRSEAPTIPRAALFLGRRDGAFLLARRPPDGLLGGMWELPAAEPGPEETTADAARALASRLGLRARLEPRGRAAHQFTHRRWEVQVWAAQVPARWRPRGLEPGGWRFVRQDELAELAIPTATRKVLRAARQERAG